VVQAPPERPDPAAHVRQFPVAAAQVAHVLLHGSHEVAVVDVVKVPAAQGVQPDPESNSPAEHVRVP
jgi:hypothetical protein